MLCLHQCCFLAVALSHTVASRPQSNNLPLRDPQVATRSSLSLLKGVPASKPATGTSNLSYSTGNPPGRGRANSRSLSPNARMHSRPRVANSYDDNYEQNNNYQSRSHNYGHNAMLTPDAESVHFFSASDVEPESVPSSRGTSIYLDGRPHRDSHSSRGGQGQGQAQVHTQSRRDGGYHATDYNVSAVSSRGGGGGGYNGEDAADYSYSGYNVPTRTYPPANYKYVSIHFPLPSLSN